MKHEIPYSFKKLSIENDGLYTNGNKEMFTKSPIDVHQIKSCKERITKG